MIGKGIEPHPTDGYHSVSFLTTLRLMERPLSRHLVMPWVMRGVRNSFPHSLLTIIQNHQLFVKTIRNFFLEPHGRWCWQYHIHTFASGREVVTKCFEFFHQYPLTVSQHIYFNFSTSKSCGGISEVIQFILNPYCFNSFYFSHNSLFSIGVHEQKTNSLTLYLLLYSITSTLSRQIVSFFSFFSGKMSGVVWKGLLLCGLIWRFVRVCERGFLGVWACGKITTSHPI